MLKSKKLKKLAVLSASGLLLFMAGGNPMVQNMIQNAKSHIEMPTSHADNSNKFNLSKRITTKQFTNINYKAESNKINVTDSEVNKKVSKRVDKYLRSVNNLSDYHVHISRFTTVATYSNSCANSETATITFIRK